MALFHGTLDRLADPRDVDWLLTQLPEDKVVHVANLTDFGHATFIWGDHMDYF
jgi:hypothetical protein